MKLKRYDFTSFDQFEESNIAGEYEAITVIDENGWLKSDIMTECKSWKTALRRFFKMLGDDSRLYGWYECMREGAENGCFKLNDYTMGDGGKNEFPGYAYEIEEVDEGVWYIFLNVKYTEYTEEPEQKEEVTSMTQFPMIEKNVQEDHDKRTADTVFYIRHGYMPTWAKEHCTDPDRGLKEHSTATRWEQYRAGTITREKAVELATIRAAKEIDKNTAAQVAQLDRVGNAPVMAWMSISVEWVKNSYWGNNPRAEARTHTGTFTGKASGCGYDKESAAIAEALNKCDSVLKALYTLKEAALMEGKTDESKTASCGRSNGAVCGYGAGYGAIPYFEGGVGSSCFWSILKKCGYTVHEQHSKHSDFYSIEKEGA